MNLAGPKIFSSYRQKGVSRQVQNFAITGMVWIASTYQLLDVLAAHSRMQAYIYVDIYIYICIYIQVYMSASVTCILRWCSYALSSLTVSFVPFCPFVIVSSHERISVLLWFISLSCACQARAITLTILYIHRSQRHCLSMHHPSVQRLLPQKPKLFPAWGETDEHCSSIPLPPALLLTSRFYSAPLGWTVCLLGINSRPRPYLVWTERESESFERERGSFREREFETDRESWSEREREREEKEKKGRRRKRGR